MTYQQFQPVNMPMSAPPAPGWSVEGYNVNTNTAFMPLAVQQTSGMYQPMGQTAPPEMSMPLSRYADGYQRTTSLTNIEYVQDLRKKLYGEIPEPVTVDNQVTEVADSVEKSEENKIDVTDSPAKPEDNKKVVADKPPDVTDSPPKPEDSKKVVVNKPPEDDDALKAQIKKLFVDELMRRQAVCGTFDLTQGTIQEMKTYPPSDPVVTFYKSTESEDLAGKPWNPEADSMYLRKAMKGVGTDEDAIIHIVVTRCNAQRQVLKEKYTALYGRDLIEDLESELSGNFREVVWAMFVKPAKYDAWSVKEAIYDAVGTDEAALMEVLLSRSNAQIQEMKTVYPDVSSPLQKAGDRKLERDIVDDTSGDFKRLLVSASQGQRHEITREQLEFAVEEIEMNGNKTGVFDINYSKLCDMKKVKSDAQKLFKAGEDCWGTDEETFVRIFGSMDVYHLRAAWTEYVKITQRDILNSIDRETSGDFRRGLEGIVMNVRCRPMYFAKRLLKAMKGAGTDDKTLIRIIVSRTEIDLVQIKKCFLDLTKKTLWQWIEDECSGDYKKILQLIIGKD